MSHKINDLSGQRFGKLVALQYDHEKKKWLCQCDCGKQWYVRADHLVGHRVISCGCSKRERLSVDLSGKRFGKLVALYSLNKTTSNGHIYWHCKCDCGNEVDVPSSYLTYGNTKSCGCLVSYGEMVIAQILTKLNISFNRQQTFIDCVNPKTGVKLKFDFYLPDYNCCIEYDGKQHFEYNDNGWDTKQDFKNRVYRDTVKDNYCLSKNIKLFRISYKDKNKLNTDFILSLLENGI